MQTLDSFGKTEAEVWSITTVEDEWLLKQGWTKSSSYLYGADNMIEVTKKWVKNLSSTPLTEDQERLLAHGPNMQSGPGNHLSENM